MVAQKVVEFHITTPQESVYTGAKKNLHPLPKAVLWVSVGQRSAELQAVKDEGQKNFGQARAKRVRTRPIGRIFFDLKL